MQFPDWAPVDVVEFQSNFLESKNEFAAKGYSNDELELYAKREGFQCWRDFESSIELQYEVIQRLLTRPEMKNFWEWLSDQDVPIEHLANYGIIGQTMRSIRDWFTTRKATTTNRDEELKEIAKHARELARLLRKYQGERQPVNECSAIIPKSRDQQLKELLKQEYLDSLETAPHRVRYLWNWLLPPIDEMMDNLAKAASNSSKDLPPRFPRKIGANSAFRTFLINVMVDWFNLHLDSPSPTMLALYLTVALDDPGISIDTVSKSETSKRWKKTTEDYE